MFISIIIYSTLKNLKTFCIFYLFPIAFSSWLEILLHFKEPALSLILLYCFP